MNQQMGLSEFFAMEASEYLERLDAVVSTSGSPNLDELVGLARQLRGSALMAKQAPIAEAATSFERFARSVQGGKREWDEATKQTAIRAVDDFKILVRQLATWSEAEDAKAAALAEELDPGGTRASAEQAAPAAEPLDSGTRAFIGREGAAVASALDQTAKALQQDPGAEEPLERLLTGMQPLRGLAMLAELPPMPDVLDGVEQAVSEIAKRSEPVADVALVFNAAAKALSRATREISTEGLADPDSEEFRDFAARLGTLLELDEDLEPIEGLYHDDSGPHVVQRGTASMHPAELGRLELVSHGEHLRLAADQLERAQSSAQRELRAGTLTATFRALSVASGGPMQDAVARFAAAARQAVGRGAASEQTGEFAANLREAGLALSELDDANEAATAERLGEITSVMYTLPSDGEPVATTPPEAPAEGALARPPADSLPAAPPVAPVFEPAPEPQPVVTPPRPPVQAAPPAAPAPEPEPEPVAASEPAAAPPQPVAEPARSGVGEETPDLAGSWSRYQRYADTLGMGEPSLDELLAGPPADPTTAAPVAPAAAADDVVIPIAELCYGGEDALRRAVSLRARIRTAMEAGQDRTDLRDLIEEALDLVELGLAQHE
jgi:outer membrane biosynthesis protein TonB